MSNHVQRLISAGIFLPFFFYALFSPFEYHLILLLIGLGLSWMITREILQFGSHHPNFWLPIFFPLSVNGALVVYAFAAAYSLLPTWLLISNLPVPFPIFFIFLWIMVPQFWRKDLIGSLSSTGIGWIAIFYGGWFITPLFALQAFDGGFFLLYIAATAWAGDAGCYYMGKTFGRHKVPWKVSPSKTYEGYIGGFLLGTAFTLGLFLGLFDTILHILPQNAFWVLPWWVIAILTLVLVVIGSLGDLVESMMKRSATMKDSEGYIPGHGGVFDVFDSFLFLLPMGYLILYLLNPS